MKNCVIRAFKRPCRLLLYLQVIAETGKVRFIARNVRARSVEKITLSVVATAEIMEEIYAKSVRHARYGRALQTLQVSEATKKFINTCWNELKELKPQFCIK